MACLLEVAVFQSELRDTTRARKGVCKTHSRAKCKCVLCVFEYLATDLAWRVRVESIRAPQFSEEGEGGGLRHWLLGRR